jgi:hypothetical protein
MKINKKEYFKQYYLKNKDKIKDNSRKSYLKKKGVVNIPVEVKKGSFFISFN